MLVNTIICNFLIHWIKGGSGYFVHIHLGFIIILFFLEKVMLWFRCKRWGIYGGRCRGRGTRGENPYFCWKVFKISCILAGCSLLDHTLHYTSVLISSIVLTVWILLYCIMFSFNIYRFAWRKIILNWCLQREVI